MVEDRSYVTKSITNPPTSNITSVGSRIAGVEGDAPYGYLAGLYHLSYVHQSRTSMALHTTCAGYRTSLQPRALFS
jgi:hypothetical protein